MSGNSSSTDLPSATPSEVQPACPALQGGVSSGTELHVAIQQEVCRLGFDRFSFRRCNVGAYSVIDSVSTFGEIHLAWRQTYRQQDFAAIDPRFYAAASSPVPEIWYRTRYPDTPKFRALFDSAEALGVGVGVSLALYRPDQSVVDFFHITTSNPYVDAARKKRLALALPEIWSLAIYGYTSGARRALAEGAKQERPLLTERQMECLTLAARGSSSRRIAEALGISERTVEAHIQACTVRLNARNRGEAIANAIGSGVINPYGRVRSTTCRTFPPRGASS